MMVKLCDRTEWLQCLKHKQFRSPREKKKDYSKYDCIVCRTNKGRLAAYVFFWKLTGEIHSIWMRNRYSKHYLKACIKKVIEISEEDGVYNDEVSTFISYDDYEWLQFFKELGFEPTHFKAIYKTKRWYEREGLHD